MEYNSIEEIKIRFGIKADELVDIRKILRQRMKEIHPDNKNGDFEKLEDKETYISLDNAIKYIDQHKKQSKELVTKSEYETLTTLIKSVVPQMTGNANVKTLSDTIETNIKSFRRHHLFPKITTASIGAILTAIWLFPQTIADHPILSTIININYYTFTIIWLFLIIAVTLYWLIISWRENSEEVFKHQLTIESIQNQIFNNYIRVYSQMQNAIRGDYIVFTKSNFINYLTDYKRFDLFDYKYERKRKSLFNFYKIFLLKPACEIDIELAQTLSDVIIQRALDNYIIKKDVKMSLSGSYLINKDYGEIE